MRAGRFFDPGIRTCSESCATRVIGAVVVPLSGHGGILAQFPRGRLHHKRCRRHPRGNATGAKVPPLFCPVA